VEIVTYVRSGAVTHQDTLGNAYEIRAGDVQVMSAGTGIRHAEVNRGDRPLKLFQIWIAPNHRGGNPSYATRHRPWRDRPNELVVLVEEGDGVAVTDEATLELNALRDTELVVVELA
jgi:redox-sensitive bicupin YhaK (pirin superfamily)